MAQWTSRTVEQTIRSQNIHYPPTTLLCLENTHNRCGGSVLSAEYTAEICGMAHSHGLKVHLDGARIFNAEVALGVPAATLAAPADSVCFCLSKGLSAPVGSLLCGSKDFIVRARKLRKMVGGGMRQAGVIAAAGIIAIEKMVQRLAEDHANAKKLALGIASIKGMSVEPAQTNIVMFEPPENMEAPAFIKLMQGAGVLFTYPGGHRVRAVVHRMISSADIDEALTADQTVDREGCIICRGGTRHGQPPEGLQALHGAPERLRGCQPGPGFLSGGHRERRGGDGGARNFASSRWPAGIRRSRRSLHGAWRTSAR